MVELMLVIGISLLVVGAFIALFTAMGVLGKKKVGEIGETVCKAGKTSYSAGKGDEEGA